jgi:flavin reductase
VTNSFKNAMAAAVTGVYVVTTDGPAGRVGLTVNSMASVSAEPPMLLVSINRESPLLPAIVDNDVFGVNALGLHHAGLAETFAGRVAGAGRYDFGAARWERGESGVPLLCDASARFDCEVSYLVSAGSHVVVIGSVRDASRGAVAALAYTRRDYARPAPLPARDPATYLSAGPALQDGYAVSVGSSSRASVSAASRVCST